MTQVRVVLATDKFKGSLTAAEVAEALAVGLHRERPELDVVRVPVADGGDGTLDAFVSAGFMRCPVTVAGPTGTPVDTAYARRGPVAVVELADASGLVRLPGTSAPLTATTYGTGEVVRSAIAAGCREVVVGVGGSASTDGGAGLLTALGARILDSEGRPVAPGGVGLLECASLDLEPMRELMAGVAIAVASDVDNPLLGPDGAAAIYGPQKGARPDEVELLERALTRWADLVHGSTGDDVREEPGAGAAGGTGFGLMAGLGARLESGARIVLQLVGLADLLSGADLVVTGEGSFDEQSLRGKAPYAVLTAARAAGVPVAVVCGRATLTREELQRSGVAHLSALSDREPVLSRSMELAGPLLEDVGAELARWLPAAGSRGAPQPGQSSV